jgi:low temperature requirement protein LtrA
MYPRFAVAALVGNICFIAAWAAALMRPNGWQVVGPVLLVAFLVLRVGGMWLYASRQTEGRQQARRTAVFTTVLALVAVGLWVATVLRGPRAL